MSAKKYRKERVADAIKRLLSTVIRAEIRNPDVPLFTTVTDVEVSSDLSYATVYVSIPGSQKEKAKALEALQKSKGFLRSRIASEIRLMHTPDLIVKEDTSLEYAMNIEKKLDEIMGRNRNSSTSGVFEKALESDESNEGDKDVSSLDDLLD